MKAKSARFIPLVIAIAFLIPAIVGAVQVGQPAPDFNLRTLDGGQQVQLKSLRGKVVVLDFWASYCGPCVKAFPHLDAIQREFGSKGVKVVTVNVDYEASAARKALGGAHQFTVLHDPEESVYDQYGLSALPATLVIGRDGRIRFFETGKQGVSAARLKQAVQAAL